MISDFPKPYHKLTLEDEYTIVTIESKSPDCTITPWIEMMRAGLLGLTFQPNTIDEYISET